MRLELGSFPLSLSHPTALLTSFGEEGGGKFWRSLHLLLGLRAGGAVEILGPTLSVRDA